jgi:hypothetical protein
MSEEFFRWRSHTLSIIFLMVILALTSCRGWPGKSARLSSKEISRAEQALQDFSVI